MIAKKISSKKNGRRFVLFMILKSTQKQTAKIKDSSARGLKAARGLVRNRLSVTGITCDWLSDGYSTRVGDCH